MKFFEKWREEKVVVVGEDEEQRSLNSNCAGCGRGRGTVRESRTQRV